MLLGYDERSKLYKLRNRAEHRTIVSREVLFEGTCSEELAVCVED